MKKIIKYVILDILRNKILLAYTFFLLVISFSVFNLEDNSSRGLLSLLNIILFIVPLVSIVFSAVYVYNTSEFIELLVSQPLRRHTLWLSLFTGLAVSLSLAFLAGAGIPVLLYDGSGAAWVMAGTGILLSVTFVSIALLAVVKTRDKARGIGLAILLWFFFALIYDGLVLFLLFQFSDYPLDTATIAMSALNPVDMGRILILIRLDASALMGYSGAVFRQFFGSTAGIAVASACLVGWIVAPLWLSLRQFRRKDM